MIPIWFKAAPYLLAAAIGAGAGFSTAWWVQGVRLNSVRNEFEGYKTEQVRMAAEAAVAAEQRRAETIRDYERKLKQIGDDHEIYRRCVAAGKCGSVRPVPTCATGIRLPTASGVDAASANAVPAASGEPAVLSDCAVTTLMLNELQSDIEKQTK